MARSNWAIARDGRLRPGSRLPSSRALAKDLGVARNTVTEAYGQLVAEGWLATRVGAGTWVAERPRSAAAATAGRVVGKRDVRYDLRAGFPDLSTFPRPAWLAASRRALAGASHGVMGYGDPRGLPEIRSALRDYLSRARGVAVDTERIVVCAGFAQGLALLCQVLRRRGATTVATEAYGHRLHHDIIENSGLRRMPLAVDEGGVVPEELGAADALLLTPAHQFPLGVSLHPVRRRDAAKWTNAGSRLIIEDDYDGEFRYDRQPLGAMQAHAPNSIVYAGSASKSLVPGLRLGWLVLPPDLVEEVAAAQGVSGGLPGSIEQLTLAEFVRTGAYDRQIRRARLSYRRRRDRLVTALAREAPDVRVTGLAAGLQAVVRLAPPGAVVARAADRGLIIEGLGDYAVEGWTHQPAIVVGYATPRTMPTVRPWPGSAQPLSLPEGLPYQPFDPRSLGLGRGAERDESRILAAALAECLAKVPIPTTFRPSTV